MSENYPQRRREIHTALATLIDTGAIAPTLGAFSDLHAHAVAPGKLGRRTKELIALAIAVAQRCDDCIAYHVHDALEAGATREQILEAVGVAVMMGGGPSFVYACRVHEALEQYQGQKHEPSPPHDAALAGTGVMEDPD